MAKKGIDVTKTLMGQRTYGELEEMARLLRKALGVEPYKISPRFCRHYRTK